MSYPGRLRFRVQIYARVSDGRDLGAFSGGESRRAEIESTSASDEEVAAGLVGLDRVKIHIRLDAETRTWDTSMRLLEVHGPSGLNRSFEIIAPPQIDWEGGWIVIMAAAGGIENLDE